MPRGVKRGKDLPKVERPQHALFSAHPFNNKTNHDALLRFLKRRLESGREIRDARLRRMAKMDKQVSAWSYRSVEDIDAELEKEESGLQSPTNMNIPVTLKHLDDMTTYFMQIFAPINGMYNLSGSNAQNTVGQALTQEMENQATHAGTFRQIRRACFAALKYNLAGFHIYWDREYGNRLLTGSSQEVRAERTEVWSGNRMNALDMYNTFWDPTVNPIKCHKDGEFSAHIDITNLFQVERDSENGVYTNTEYLMERDQHGEPVIQGSEYAYYVDPPAYAQLDLAPDGTDDSNIDWYAFAGYADTAFSRREQVERVTMYVRINPYRWYLVPGNSINRQTRNRREVWRITILNGDTIVETSYMNNVHECLPMLFMMPIDDDMELSQRSPGEIAEPFQTFISYLYNTTIQANRKNLFGTTFYDPTRIDYDAVPQGEAAARVPMKPAGVGQDIRTMVYHDDNILDTTQNAQTMENAMNLLEQLLPLQANPAQIASIDRAVKNQVASVKQGANRRIHGIARLLDNQAFRPARVLMYYNILQYLQRPIDVTIGGQSQSVQPAQLRDLELQFILGNGLQALDLEGVIENLRDLIFAILQSQQAAEQFDVPALLNYLSTQMNMNVNLDQFKRVQPPVALEEAGNVSQPQPESDNARSA